MRPLIIVRGSSRTYKAGRSW